MRVEQAMAVADGMVEYFRSSAEGPDRSKTVSSFVATMDEKADPLLAMRVAERLVEAGILFALDGGRHPLARSYFRAGGSAQLAYGAHRFAVGGFKAVRSHLLDAACLMTGRSGQDQGQGSAVYLCDGMFVTAAHCIDDLADPVVHYCGEPLPVGRSVSHPTADLAVFEIEPDRGLAAPELKVRAPDHLEPVLAMGFPRISRIEPTLVSTVGHVSANGVEYDLPNPGLARQWLVTAPGRGGNSGGPVLSEDGMLVGVVSRSLQDVDDVNGAGYLAMVDAMALLELACDLSQRDAIEVLRRLTFMAPRSS